MKKLAFVIVALAIVLGFLSCKKETVDVKEPLVFSISADIDDDSKATVTPLGKIEFKKDDLLYLAYKGLNGKNSIKFDDAKQRFKDRISLNNYNNETDAGKVPFHFFYLTGIPTNKEKEYLTEKALSAESTSTAVCISLQNRGKDINGKWNDDKYKDRAMPLLCFGVSEEKFSGAKDNELNVSLRNKCALVKYVVEAGIDCKTEIVVKGLNNVVEVDFKVPYYKYMSEKYGQMENELEESLAQGYDYDGFRFKKRAGIFQNGCRNTYRSESITSDIIIPYRVVVDNSDKTICYSLLLPQTGGLDTLSGYYYDGENEIPLTFAVYDKDYKPVQNIVENEFYTINVKSASKGNQ